MSLRQIAKELGVSPSVLVLWRQGKRNLSPELEARYHLVTSGYRSGYNNRPTLPHEIDSIDTKVPQVVAAVDTEGAADLSSIPRSGRNSVAECLLPKQKVVGSNPIARSRARI